MELSEEAILEFQEIYKEVYKREVSYEKAKELAENFMGFCMLIFRPTPSQVREKNLEKN
ncbi:hypothetical protein ACFL2A_05810 [Thermodesulfobacteriota bacterium]